jgi:hypothetical protein
MKVMTIRTADEGAAGVKRVLSGLFVLLLLTICAMPAQAHTISVTGAWSLKGNQLTVKAADPYGAAVEGGTVTAATGAPGAKPGKALPLREIDPGIYTGIISPPDTGEYDTVVEITVVGQLFRGSLRMKAGTDMAETLVPMLPIDPPQGFGWGPVLYGAAAIVLIVATVIAIMKRPHGEETEEG